ncbi:MAG: isoprenylcysteine carboxylmethyltransferase family protein [Syntrophobacteraceae bacterium]
MLIESRISKRDVTTEGKRTSDSASCQIYGIGQALTFLTALWFPPVWQAPSVAHFFGICLFTLGGCYRLWAVRTLGVYYSHRVRTVAQHQIIDAGPYRVIRHPAYAGMIIANTGVVVYFFNLVTCGVFLLMLLPAILFRISIEEKMLFEIPEYSEYARKRKRLIPKVW